MARLPVFEKKRNYGSLRGCKDVTTSDEWHMSLQDRSGYDQIAGII
jgi:hypothetical protein